MIRTYFPKTNWTIASRRSQQFRFTRLTSCPSSPRSRCGFLRRNCFVCGLKPFGRILLAPRSRRFTFANHISQRREVHKN